MDIKNKFRGAFLWSAIGDAIGSAFEFRSLYNIQNEITKTIKAQEVIPAVSKFMSVRGITDDTMMSLYQAQSIIERSQFDPEDTATKFVDWVVKGDKTGGIGKTTAAAIAKLRRGVSWDQAGQTGERAAGNGCSMRIFPVALFYHNCIEKLAEHCTNSAKITHNCDEAFAGTKAVAFAVAAGFCPNKDNILLQAAQFAGPSVTADKLKKAHEMLEKQIHPIKALQTIGCGGYVAENAAAAIYCVAYSHARPLESVMNSILAGGDTDTTAAVTGAICGAWNGPGNIPQEWLTSLQYDDKIISMSDGLYSIWENNHAQ